MNRVIGSVLLALLMSCAAAESASERIEAEPRVSRSSGAANFIEGDDRCYFQTGTFVDRTVIALFKGSPAQLFWGTTP
jgi:hypothetical protein